MVRHKLSQLEVILLPSEHFLAGLHSFPGSQTLTFNNEIITKVVSFKILSRTIPQNNLCWNNSDHKLQKEKEKRSRSMLNLVCIIVSYIDDSF